MQKNYIIPTMLKNSIVGIMASAISTVSIYGIRVVISQVLGEEIYGINSIFISIVSSLLILEFGMSAAIIIILYQPVAEDDEVKVKSILSYIRDFYRCFFFFIIVVGLITDLFLLNYFVNTSVAFDKVRIYFLLYILGIGFKYLWSYKQCLLYANKENSIISLATIISTIVFTVLQISCIYCYENYALYLWLYLLQNVAQNALCNIYANKRFPYIKEKISQPLSCIEKTRIRSILRPMFIQRIADQVKDSSSVVILGAIGSSASVVGFFSNYIFVVHACQTLFNQVGASFTTSYGNYSTNNVTDEEKFNYYTTSRFYMSWISTVFATMYMCIIQDFIGFFFGEGYKLENSIAILLSLYIFVVLNSSINLATQNAVGAHRLDSKEIICQAILLVILQVVLGSLYNSLGIVLGLLLSVSFFTGIIKGMKIVRYIYGKPMLVHVCLWLKEFVVFIFISSISLYIYVVLLKPSSLYSFVVSSIIILFASNMFLYSIYIRSPKLYVIKSIVAKILSSK